MSTHNNSSKTFITLLWVIALTLAMPSPAAAMSYYFDPAGPYTQTTAYLKLRIYPDYNTNGVGNPTRVVWKNPQGTTVTYCDIGSCGALYDQYVADNGVLVWRAFYFYISGQQRPAGTYTATAYTINGYGGETEMFTTTFSITSTPSTETFISSGASDGWVLETTETSQVGGALNATAATFRLGDDAGQKQYRSLLSFNTGTLPDNADITSVTLKIKKQAITGPGDPLVTFQGFMADLKTGVFGAAALAPTDFQSPYGLTGKTYGPFKPALVGGWYSLNLTAGKTYINKAATASGLTQIRLRFKLDDNDNAVANYLSFHSGNATTIANRPQLIIRYSVP